MTTLKDFKSGQKLSEKRIYIHDSIVVLKDNVVLYSGDEKNVLSLPEYYDNCDVNYRNHDLYRRDNSKIESAQKNINSINPVGIVGYVTTSEKRITCEIIGTSEINGVRFFICSLTGKDSGFLKCGLYISEFLCHPDNFIITY